MKSQINKKQPPPPAHFVKVKIEIDKRKWDLLIGFFSNKKSLHMDERGRITNYLVAPEWITMAERDGKIHEIRGVLDLSDGQFNFRETARTFSEMNEKTACDYKLFVTKLRDTTALTVEELQSKAKADFGKLIHADYPIHFQNIYRQLIHPLR